MAAMSSTKKTGLVVLAVVVLVGAWDTYGFLSASGTDTAAAYADYISGFPILWESKAIDKHDDAIFKTACDADTFDAYRTYLKTSRRKLHQDEAVEREDDALFRWATEQDTVLAMAKYADELPEGGHIAEVDDALYGVATREGTISALRVYLSRFSAGKHHKEAIAAIGQVSDQAFKGYHEAAKERGADRRALDTMLAVASFVNRTDRRTLQVTFESFDESGIPVIGSHDWAGDETRATEEIRSALTKMFHEDVIRVQKTGTLEADALQLHVRYSLTKTGVRFSSTSGGGFGYGLAQDFEGVRFDWKFRLVVPETPPKEYNFSFSTNPAEHFTVTYQRPAYGMDLGPSESDVYKAMIATAFKDFQEDFMRRFGF